MQYNKLKKIILLTMIVSTINIPAMAHTNNVENTNSTTQINVDIQIKIQDNWLTQEVARQLNKSPENLTELDFLSITKIDLKEANIKDEIPKEINLLKDLEYLNLHNSKLNGQIPENLGDLPKLIYLDLGDNNFKTLPDNIRQKIIDKYYNYCDVEGNKFKLDKGWYFLKGKWCYLDKNGERITGVQTIDKKEYTFDEDGNVALGWTNKGDDFYYYDGLNGMMLNSWKQVDGKWHYFNEKGVMQRGLQNIQGVKYYLNSDGTMATGWQYINNKWYHFAVSGGMEYGWLNLNNRWYYLDKTTGVMTQGDITIDNKKYRFSIDGTLITNVWLDDYTYVQANGIWVNTYYDYSHSNTNYQLFKYMTNLDNEDSVDKAAISLHGGDTNNTCVYFASEALRRIGVNIPYGTGNTYELENQLKGMGFVTSYDLSQLKPGDIVFTNGYTHAYIFMYWDTDGYAYVVDNQRTDFDNNVLHRRSILQDDGIIDKASHFFYYPN